MAQCVLFGSPYWCPDATEGSDPLSGYDFSAWQSWQIGDATPEGIPATQAEGGQAPSVNDVVAIGSGLVGMVMQIVQGVAGIKAEDGSEVSAPAAQVPVLSSPPPAPQPRDNGAMDWTPVLVGGGVLLGILMLFMMGSRR